MATADAKADKESKMNRLRVGDTVTYTDESDWPPVVMEGKIKAFANEECTYLTVDFEGDERELTEDEVTRVA